MSGEQQARLSAEGNQARGRSAPHRVARRAAGTGKTQVLSARVLRLLLQPGVEPEHPVPDLHQGGRGGNGDARQRGAGRWVRLPETALAEQLIAIGADYGPKRWRARAAGSPRCSIAPAGSADRDDPRLLPVAALGLPGGSGLMPGTRAMEDRDPRCWCGRCWPICW
jgi:ATP-dependent helicase/nuclease subunit A